MGRRKINKPAKSEPKVALTGENIFEYESKRYKVLKHALHIPDIGKLTAADICADTEDSKRAQKHLVEHCVGSSVEEVIE